MNIRTRTHTALAVGLMLAALPVSAHTATTSVEGTVTVSLGATSTRPLPRDERKATSTASSTQAKQERMEDRYAAISNKAKVQLSHTADNLESIASRLETRIAKVNATGTTTASSTALLAEARVHITAARALFSSFPTASATTTLGQNVKMLREAVNGVKAHLKEARASLTQAVRTLPRPEARAKAEAEVNAQ